MKFDGTESSDVDGKIVKYFFNFGDGQIIESSTPTVEHTYKFITRNCKIEDDKESVKRSKHFNGDGNGNGNGNDDGNGNGNGNTKNLKVELTVVDNDNAVSKSAQKVVTVKCQKNSPPVIGADQTLNGLEDQILNFNLNSAADDDNDLLGYTLVSAPNIGTLVNCLDGMPGLQCIYIPKPNYFGPVTFKYKVNDGIYDSETATVTLNIAPTNDAPEMKGAQNFSTNEDTPINFTLNAASDVDGDILKYRIVVPPQNGKVENCLLNNNILSCKFTPDQNFNGAVTFSYVANDGHEDAVSPSVVIINVIAVNDAPKMANDQTFNGTEDNELSFTLSGATDIENDNLTFSIVSPPQNGLLRNCLGGSNKLDCTFVPSKDFNGKVTFTYKANDGKVDSDTVSTVTLNFVPVNDIPVLIGDQSFQVNEDTTYHFNVNGATDVDEDVLTYKLIVSPNVGTLSGCLNNTSNKACSYTPPKDYNGTVTFTYQANDEHVDSDGDSKITIQVLPVNDPPIVSADQVLATSEDTPFNFTLSKGADSEGDTLKYKIVTQPTSGTLTGCLDNTSSLECHYVPAQDFNGPVTITYKVNDGTEDSETFGKITINVASVNDAPVIGANQAFNGQEDSALSFKISAATDVDGDNLIYKLVSAPSNGTLQGCLENNSSIDCTFIPNKDFNGTVEFTYKVSDGTLESQNVARVTLNIHPVNDSPVMRGDQSLGLFEDQMTVIILSGASDIDNDNLTYSLVKAPVGGTLSGCLDNTGSLICTLTPDLNFNGDLEFTYKANDGISDSSNVSTVTLHVWPVNDPPVMGADQTLSMNENSSLTFTINEAFDVEGDILKYKVILPPSSGSLSGCLEDNQDLTCTFTPAPNFYGDITIRYRAHDGQISTAKLGTINIKVLMVNSAPIMANNLSIETDEDKAIDFLIPEASDSDNDNLSYSIVSAPNVGVLSGCLGNNASFNCHYIPPENFNGIVSFTYKANDGRLDSENVTEVIINVRPISDIPYVGKSQVFSLDENSKIEFSISKGGDLEGDELIYKLVNGPSHGAITGCLNNSNSLNCTYTPNVDFKGEDFLTYKVNDGINDSTTIGTITFKINEINRAPVIANSLSVEINEDSVLEFSLPVATDANGDSVTYWPEQAFSSGKLENCLGGTGDVECKFTPDKDFNGVTKFSYFAFDGKLRSTIKEIAIKVLPVNDPPVLGLNQEFKFLEDQKSSLTVNAAKDVDTDLNLIFYSIVSPPTRGVLSNCFNLSNDLQCDYTPEDDFSGEVEFTYVASDGIAFSLEVGKVKLNILPVNDKPTFEKIQVTEANADEDSKLKITPAEDKDGDELAYKIIEESPNASLLNCLGNTKDLECDFSPKLGFSGDVTFKIRAYDGKEYSEDQIIKVTVLSPPVNPTMISGYQSHVCAVLSSGNLICWGYNVDGELGLGHTSGIGAYELVTGAFKVSVGGKVSKVATGVHHTCALLTNGYVRCWGENRYGQLGSGYKINIGDNELPSSWAPVNLGKKAIDIYAGAYHSCAILEDKTVKCWGRNAYGQLGLGHTTTIGDNETPNTVPSISLGGDAKQLALGAEHSCALLTNGEIKCWGSNANSNCMIQCLPNCTTVCTTDLWGSLGLGRQVIIGDNELPSSVENVSVGGIAVKIVAGDRNTCALLNTGKLKCWGDNKEGSLGYANTQIIGDNETPINVGDVNVGGLVKDVSTSGLSTCVILVNNQVKCWGGNNYGQLGQPGLQTIGDNETPSTIGTIQLGDEVSAITTYWRAVCAILKNSEIKCWGYNLNGQLGLGHQQHIGDDEIPASAVSIKLNSAFSIAEFFIDTTNPIDDTNIIFNGMNSKPSKVNGEIVKYEWDFGDGSSEEGAIVSHAYSKVGKYEARLVVTDNEGVTGVSKKYIDVLEGPKPISQIIASTNTGFASLKINFDGSKSLASEASATLVSYEWDFGDSQAPIAPVGIGAVGRGAFASGVTAEHIYTTPGIYTAKLTVTDSKNKKNTSFKTIAVLDSLPPTALFQYSSLQGKQAPVDVSFDASNSIPGSFDGKIVSYKWIFGDGSVGSNPVIDHTFVNEGVYKVILKVTDDRGKVGEKEVVLDIPAQSKPKAIILANREQGPRPMTVSFDGSTSYASSVDGNITKYEWSFGDGQIATGNLVNHVYTEQGTFEARLVVTDNLGRVASEVIAIEVLPSNPPVADFIATDESPYPHVPIGVDFDASSSSTGDSGKPIVSYSWTFSDGGTALGKTVNHTFLSPGNYEIVLKVTNSDGEYSIKKIVKNYDDSLSINVVASQEVLFEGSYFKLTPIIHDPEGRIVYYPVTWSSSDPNILEIVGNGTIFAKAVGSGTVTAQIGKQRSVPVKLEVKKKSTFPELLISSDYFLKSFEDELIGGVFGLSSQAYLSSIYSPYPKISKNTSNIFYMPISIMPGERIVPVVANDVGGIKNLTQKSLKFFDGHGNSLYFNGADKEAQINLDKVFNKDQSFSLGLWLRLGDINVSGDIINFKDPQGKGINISFDSKKSPIIQIDTEASLSYLFGESLKTNEWTHILLSFDASLKKLSFYQNGRLISQRTAHHSFPWIENELAGKIGGNEFVGLIDEINIFDKAVTDLQIKSLMFNKNIETIPPQVSFSFEGVSSQIYKSGPSNSSYITLGTTVGYDLEDPKLRFSSQVVASKIFTPGKGGVLAFQGSNLNKDLKKDKLSFELAPFILNENLNVTLELLDADTPGFLPEGISENEFLLRLHPVVGVDLKKPGILTVPINTEKYRKNGSISLYYYQKSYGEIYRKRPVNISLNEQIASFPISEFGTYFTSYDSNFIPQIEYDGSNISDEPFDFEFDKRVKAKFKGSGAGPFNIKIDGSLDGANIYYAVCEKGNVQYSKTFPVYFSGMPLGQSYCLLYFKKRVDDKNSLYLRHIIELVISN